MKKIRNLVLVSLTVFTVVVLGFALNPSKAKGDVVDKIYTYAGEGFGGEFTVTINGDGTASFYEGYLSSYIGEGTWNIEDGILFLNDNTFKNKFRVHEDELEFIEDGSMNFPYVKVTDGEKFKLNK